VSTERKRLHLVPPPRPAEREEAQPVPAGPVVDLASAFRAHARYVGHIALRILGRPDEVEDLVQDVFLDAQKQIVTLRDPEALKGWLATITVRKSVRKLQRRKVHDKTLVRELYRLLDQLPAEERSAWVLRHVEGEKVERVAELCGCSLATAKRRIAAAHAVLYGELGDV
jgi:RNA polymerase sigma-70 factor (ECF subfamily)